MAYVRFFNALGQGGYIRAGDFDVYGTGELVPDYNETYSVVDSDTVLATGSFNGGAYWYGGYIDDIGYTNTYELDSAYLFDAALNDLVWLYDINVRFDIRDDFSAGVSFSNMYSGNDTFIGNRYADYIEAGKGNDLVKGYGGRDVLKGQAGKDILKGGNGDDVIRGGKGRDKEFGGKGEDTFKFNTGDDVSIIKDFDARGTSHDVIDLSGLKSVKGWSDLKNNHMERDGADVVIDGGNGDVIVINDVTLNSLDKGDFLF